LFAGIQERKPEHWYTANRFAFFARLGEAPARAISFCRSRRAMARRTKDDIHAALYVRSSKDRKDVSIPGQIEALTKLAVSKKLKVVQTYAESEESAKDEDRPEYQRMLEDIKRPGRGWTVLLMYDTARLARNAHIARAFKYKASKAGVKIIFRNIPEDTDPVSELLLHSIYEAMDEAHSLWSREKGVSGMRQNIVQGYRAGGRAPLGYKLQQIDTGKRRDGEQLFKTRLIPSDDAPKVAEYLRQRAAGKARAMVLRELGVPWPSNSMVDVERRALLYAGHLLFNQHSDGKRLERKDWQIQRDTHEALITEKEAELVMSRLDTDLGRKVSEAKRSMSEALLSDILFAPDDRRWRSAGMNYRLPAQQGKPGALIKRKEIDEAVVAQVAKDLGSEEFVNDLLEASRALVVSDEPKQLLIKRIRSCKGKRDRARDYALEHNDTYWAEQAATLDKEVRTLELELGAWEQDRRGAQLNTLTTKAVRELLADASPTALVAHLVARVVLAPDGTGTLEYRQVGDVSVASPRGFEPRSQP
jgi:DNA invertase Pin-like site-specific DNA recombinase